MFYGTVRLWSIKYVWIWPTPSVRMVMTVIITIVIIGIYCALTRYQALFCVAHMY